MELQLFGLLLLFFVAGSDAQTVKTCPSNWHMYTGPKGDATCLFVSREKANWIEAMGWCRTLGGHLAEVPTSAINVKITQLINAQQTGKYWLGLSDVQTEMDYKWMTSDQSATYTQFYHGNMSHDYTKNCVNIDEKGFWNVESCKADLWFICQKAAA